ncbi:MAG: energy-coupling factor transporter transmembrane component T [Desulfobacteraceae bacterium]|jgi:energy-coupling factor transport system permease protein
MKIRGIRKIIYDLDDRVKVWMAISAGAAAIYCVDWFLQCLILFICLALCIAGGARRFAAGYTILLLMVVGIVSLGLELTSPESSSTGMSLYFMIIKFSPMFVMMVFIQASLNTSRFLHMLDQMRIPAKYVIPLGVCLRFMPSAAAEIRQVRYAMRMRGIRFFSFFTVRHPFVMLGYMMAPILVRSLSIGEELARSAVARGIESTVQKTSIHKLSFRTVDRVVFVVWSLFFAAIIITDHHIYSEGLNSVQAVLSGGQMC